MELVFEDIRKNYGKKQALRGLTLTLTPGIYGLLGPNGAGKSTLMNILTGNLCPTAGRILFDGEEIASLGKQFRSRLGYCPQQQTLYSGYTAEQFLYYMASLQGMQKEKAAQRIAWALDAVYLSDIRKKPIKSLSGGMKQRLLLAQAILHDPDILILDEPTAGLDPRQRIAVRNLIGEIALHKIVLISTHVVQDVEYIAKELILLSEGNLVRQGTPGTLLKDMEGKVWEIHTEEADLQSLSGYGIVSGLQQEENGICVRLISETKPPVLCRQVKATLEDVYLHEFGEGEPL